MNTLHTVAIFGPWDHTFLFDEVAVRREVESHMRNQSRIISGGMFGIDFVAVDEALVFDSWAERIHIILPAELSVCEAYLLGLEKKKHITSFQVKMVLAQIKSVENANPEAITVLSSDRVMSTSSFRNRNEAIISAADEIVVFWDDDMTKLAALKTIAEKTGKNFSVRTVPKRKKSR